ncbi:MAG: hypothetical protein UX12_C0020G0007 [Candidatus Collierbacteria bacterium GW2011_GWC1_45_47]|nr:MAG: hypothetical protein UX12_C0020G0007 [Candidatus Collierbacteria bacterium GW2011_GWC1_45_47]
MKTKLCLLLLFLSTLFHFTVTRPVQALAKFSTNYQVNYTVYPSGVTHVKFLINQVNNLSVVYATEFSLSVNHTRLENIRVADENASLVPNVIRTRNGSIISFSFLNKVVGKDKKHFFTIEYDIWSRAILSRHFGLPPPKQYQEKIDSENCPSSGY